MSPVRTVGLVVKMYHDNLVLVARGNHPVVYLLESYSHVRRREGEGEGEGGREGGREGGGRDRRKGKVCKLSVVTAFSKTIISFRESPGNKLINHKFQVPINQLLLHYIHY